MFAFSDCISLESITIPESIVSIAGGAFARCTNLEEINFNATDMEELFGGSATLNYIFSEAGKNSEGIKLVIGKNVKRIPEYLFCTNFDDASYSPNITSVEFEKASVCGSIGKYAFYNCTMINSLYIDDIISWCGITFDNLYANPLYNGENGVDLYIKEELITDIAIPGSVGSIKDFAFAGCKSIKRVKIERDITSVGAFAFNRCTNLGSVYISVTVKRIGNRAFLGCYNLGDVYFADPKGWRLITSPNETGGTSVPSNIISDTYTAASNLTRHICGYDLVKS